MVDIVLKDRDGNPVTHEGVETVRMIGADGETRDFINADDVPKAVEKTVGLDFKFTDFMQVKPEAGQVFSQINISKPANLLETNIREGVDIAGIIGTMAASAGGGLKAMSGYCTLPTSGKVSVNFGFKPDFLLLFLSATSTNTAKSFVSFGVSSALNAKLPIAIYQYYTSRSSSTLYFSKLSYTIDNDAYVGIYMADETGFRIASGIYQTGSHIFLAIGGLT